MNFEKIKELIKEESKQESIGTKKERSLHQYLKYYFCNDAIYHEQRLNGYIVDIFKDGKITEIQTSSFNAMREKLEILLKNYEINIIYPIITERTLYNFDETGVLLNVRKSPKKEHPLKIGKELYKISNLLNHPNLSFTIVLLKVYEERIPFVNRYKQKKTTRINQIPYELIETIELNKQSLSKLIPFEEEFDSGIFKKKTKLSPRDSSSTLLALRKLDVIKIKRIEGKKYIYEKK